MRRRFLAFLTAVVCASVPVPARQAESPRLAQLRTAFPEVDRLLASFAERQHVPGIAYGILVDGVLVHTGFTGVRDTAAKSPVDADTVFRIASMTKSFTVLCILKLRDEGKLSLDDPAERYVPELAGLKYPTADSPKLTVRHLLTHSTGFPEDNPWGDQQLAATDAEFSAMMKGGIPFSNPPGIAYQVLELRLCHPRPHRHTRVRNAVLRVRAGQHPEAAWPGLDDARSEVSSGEPHRSRLSLGRQSMERRAAVTGWRVRIHGRHAHLDSGSRALCRLPDECVAS